MVDPKPSGPIERVVVGLVRTAFGIAIAIGAARYLVYPIDWGFMRDEITKYGLYCNTPSGEMPCSDSQVVRLEPVTFKVFVDQQVVIETSENQAPEHLKNCAVLSRTTWKCQQFPGRDFGFQEGRYWEISPDAKLSARFVNRYQWLLARDPPNQR
jgi:hypothetical protein